MKISVITVSYNAKDDIEKTIKSVVEQRFNDYEYIIVDGASYDGTVDQIRNHEKDITIWISEPDTGIYNAMNKAARIAKGDYCIFMNAGDKFANPLTLKAASLFLSDGFDVVTGCEITTKCGRVIDYIIPPAETTVEHFYCHSISHQSSFIKRSLLLEFPYDENLRLVSDWKFWIETLVLNKKTYRAIDVDISIFNHDGRTFSQLDHGLKERKKVINELIPHSICIAFENRPPSLFKRLYHKISKKFKLETKIKTVRRKIEYNRNYFTVLGISAIGVIGARMLGWTKKKHMIIAYFLSNNYSSFIKDSDTPIAKNKIIELGFTPIWVCWWQGESMMPLLPKICLKTIRKNIQNNQKVILISKDNYKEFISLPQCVFDALGEGRLPITQLSDILRFALLEKYGGLWIDSTCYVSSKLPDLKDILFYSAKQNKQDDWTYISRYRWASYLIGGKSNILFTNEKSLLIEYIKKEKVIVDYLLLDYLLDLIHKKSNCCKKIIDSCSYYNPNILCMAEHLGAQYTDELWNSIIKMDDIHKLSRKVKYNLFCDIDQMTIFGKMIDSL